MPGIQAGRVRQRRPPNCGRSENDGKTLARAKQGERKFRSETLDLDRKRHGKRETNSMSRPASSVLFNCGPPKVPPVPGPGTALQPDVTGHDTDHGTRPSALRMEIGKPIQVRRNALRKAPVPSLPLSSSDGMRKELQPAARAVATVG